MEEERTNRSWPSNRDGKLVRLVPLLADSLEVVSRVLGKRGRVERPRDDLRVERQHGPDQPRLAATTTRKKDSRSCQPGPSRECDQKYG